MNDTDRLRRGLTRAVFKHGWLPRLLNMAKRLSWSSYLQPHNDNGFVHIDQDYLLDVSTRMVFNKPTSLSWRIMVQTGLPSVLYKTQLDTNPPHPSGHVSQTPNNATSTGTQVSAMHLSGSSVDVVGFQISSGSESFQQSTYVGGVREIPTQACQRVPIRQDCAIQSTPMASSCGTMCPVTPEVVHQPCPNTSQATKSTQCNLHSVDKIPHAVEKANAVTQTDVCMGASSNICNENGSISSIKTRIVHLVHRYTNQFSLTNDYQGQIDRLTEDLMTTLDNIPKLDSRPPNSDNEYSSTIAIDAHQTENKHMLHKTHEHIVDSRLKSPDALDLDVKPTVIKELSESTIKQNTEERQVLPDGRSDKTEQGLHQSISRTHSTPPLPEEPCTSNDQKTTDYQSTTLSIYSDNSGFSVPNSQVAMLKERDIQWDLSSGGTHCILGTGSFGFVEAAKLTLADGNIAPVAVKRYHHNKSRDNFIREGKLTQYLTSTGFLPEFYGFLELGSAKNPEICLVSELFAKGTTLGDVLCQTLNSVSHREWMSVCIQLSKGIRRIHDLNVLLNDIKANNILVDMSNPGKPIVTLIDFGLATFDGGVCYNYTEEELKSLSHLAPEVKSQKPTSVLSDIWSLGVIFVDIARLSSLPGLKEIAGACLMELPEERISLGGITDTLITVARCKRLLPE